MANLFFRTLCLCALFCLCGCFSSELHRSMTEKGADMVVLKFYNMYPIALFNQTQEDFITCVLKSEPYNVAVDELIKGNRLTDGDKMFWRADFHFDSEQIIESNNNVLSFMLSAKRALEDGELNEARTMIGHGLHAVQDFYAHSNWVELGNTKVNPGVGTKEGFSVPLAGPDEPTCKPCPDKDGCEGNLITKHLTTGYWGHSTDAQGNEILKPAGKCSHGGKGDSSASLDARGGISKDSSSSAHGQDSWIAAELGETASAKYLWEFLGDISKEDAAKFLGLDKINCEK